MVRKHRGADPLRTEGQTAHLSENPLTTQSEGPREARPVPDASTPACRTPRQPRWSSLCCAFAKPAYQTPAESTQ